MPSHAKPAPVARQTRLDERSALVESMGPMSLDDALDSGEELVFLREGLARPVLRKLRRGHWVIEDSLDLHGMNRVEAALSVAEFLRRCGLRRLRCVRIVHGKGTGAIRLAVRDTLRSSPYVSRFAPEPDAGGGDGATQVFLK